MENLELLKKYACNWNTLNVSPVESFLAEDVGLFSQYFNKTVQGKPELIKTLRDTITEIKKAGGLCRNRILQPENG